MAAQIGELEEAGSLSISLYEPWIPNMPGQRPHIQEHGEGKSSVQPTVCVLCKNNNASWSIT